MVVHGLAARHPDAGGDQALERLRSNIGRCTGYAEIEAAARAMLEAARARALCASHAAARA